MNLRIKAGEKWASLDFPSVLSHGKNIFQFFLRCPLKGQHEQKAGIHYPLLRSCGLIGRGILHLFYYRPGNRVYDWLSTWHRAKIVRNALTPVLVVNWNFKQSVCESPAFFKGIHWLLWHPFFPSQTHIFLSLLQEDFPV